MKFGKHMREQMEALGPEWQRSLIPYKSLKKAIKHEELDMEVVSRWDPLLATAWSYKLDALSDLYTQIDSTHPSFERDFYLVLCRSLITLRQFLDEAFADTVHRLETLQERLYSATNPFEKDVRVWKKIFEAYKDFKVWELTNASQVNKIPFSALENQFHSFLTKLQSKKSLSRFSSSESKEALLLFLEANKQLLSLLRFCELNRVAATKIMKKFKKATHKQLSLEYAQSTISPLFIYPQKTLTLWWAILNTLPNMDDYLCPICYDILWQPARLTCGHYFCHFCCIRAQLAGQRHCPVCRAPRALIHADTTSKDRALANYLQLYFPFEVRRKQRDQERQQMVEEHAYFQGVEWVANTSCSLM